MLNTVTVVPSRGDTTVGTRSSGSGISSGSGAGGVSAGAGTTSTTSGLFTGAVGPGSACTTGELSSTGSVVCRGVKSVIKAIIPTATRHIARAM